MLCCLGLLFRVLLRPALSYAGRRRVLLSLTPPTVCLAFRLTLSSIASYLSYMIWLRVWSVLRFRFAADHCLTCFTFRFLTTDTRSLLNHDGVAAHGDFAVDAGVDTRAELARIGRGDQVAFAHAVAGFNGSC